MKESQVKFRMRSKRDALIPVIAPMQGCESEALHDAAGGADLRAGGAPLHRCSAVRAERAAGHAAEFHAGLHGL